MPVENGLTTVGCLALDRFPALDALLGVVAGLAFLDVELDAADAAVALVEHGEIVVHAVGDRDAGIGIGAGAVGEQRHVDAVLRLRRAGERCARPAIPCKAIPTSSCLAFIFIPPFASRRAARTLAFAFAPATSDCRRSSGRGRNSDFRRLRMSYPKPVRTSGSYAILHHQYGNGHTLSFCLPICQSRARPAGSAIRKKIISAPTIMKVMCSTVAACMCSPIASGAKRSTIGRM